MARKRKKKKPTEWANILDKTVQQFAKSALINSVGPSLSLVKYLSSANILNAHNGPSLQWNVKYSQMLQTDSNIPFWYNDAATASEATRMKKFEEEIKPLAHKTSVRWDEPSQYVTVSMVGIKDHLENLCRERAESDSGLDLYSPGLAAWCWRRLTWKELRVRLSYREMKMLSFQVDALIYTLSAQVRNVIVEEFMAMDEEWSCAEEAEPFLARFSEGDDMGRLVLADWFEERGQVEAAQDLRRSWCVLTLATPPRSFSWRILADGSSPEAAIGYRTITERDGSGTREMAVLS